MFWRLCGPSLLLSATLVLSADPPNPDPPAAKAASLTIESSSGGRDVPQYKLARLTVKGVPPGYTIFWDVLPIKSVDVATQKVKSVLEFVAPPGQYDVRVKAFKGDDDVLEAWYTVTISGIPPPGPLPPVPPTPVPPTPIPVPKGFRAVFAYETGEPLPVPLQVLMFGEKVTQYLDSKTVPHPTAGVGWRRYDKNVTGEKEKDPDLRELWRTQRDKITRVPVVVVTADGKADILPLDKEQDGKRVYITEDELLTLLKKYGG